MPVPGTALEHPARSPPTSAARRCPSPPLPPRPAAAPAARRALRSRARDSSAPAPACRSRARHPLLPSRPLPSLLPTLPLPSLSLRAALRGAQVPHGRGPSHPFPSGRCRPAAAMAGQSTLRSQPKFGIFGRVSSFRDDCADLYEAARARLWLLGFEAASGE